MKFAAEGCNVVVNYVSSKDRAEEVVEKCEREFGVKSTAIKAVRNTGPTSGEAIMEEQSMALTQFTKDIGIVEDCIRLVKNTVEELGGLDIIVNNAGWTKFTAFHDLDALSREEWDKVSA